MNVLSPGLRTCVKIGEGRAPSWKKAHLSYTQPFGQATCLKFELITLSQVLVVHMRENISLDDLWCIFSAAFKRPCLVTTTFVDVT